MTNRWSTWPYILLIYRWVLWCGFSLTKLSVWLRNVFFWICLLVRLHLYLESSRHQRWIVLEKSVSAIHGWIFVMLYNYGFRFLNNCGRHLLKSRSWLWSFIWFLQLQRSLSGGPVNWQLLWCFLWIVKLLGIIRLSATDLSWRVKILHKWRIKKAAVVRDHAHWCATVLIWSLKRVVSPKIFFSFNLQTSSIGVLLSNVTKN